MTDTRWLSVPAPAKLNLMLHITGRRPDGYHNLQTLFQFLDYGDTLHFRRRDDNELTLVPAIDAVPFEDNLIIRAARLLQQRAGKTCGADIRLDKTLPMGGGLGGGSSGAERTLATAAEPGRTGHSGPDPGRRRTGVCTGCGGLRRRRGRAADGSAGTAGTLVSGGVPTSAC